MASPTPDIPKSILIVGSGVFGLSTAWALCNNLQFKDTEITLVDRQPFPSADGSSIDTSRIIRADYASPPYARLASSANALWRTTFAPEHYHETGLAITTSGPGQSYVSSSLENVRAIGVDKVQELPTPEDIRLGCRLETNNPSELTGHPGGGSMGYLNASSGWADAEGAMRWLRAKVESLNRVRFLVAKVKKLQINHTTKTVSGVLLTDNTTITASLTILAAGAWTPSLLDLRGICKPTGQALVYLPISSAEQKKFENTPTILNLSTGLFIITPSRNLLKIARHGHGYTNPTTIPHPESECPHATLTTSLPSTHIDNPLQTVPREAQRECRDFLASVYPSLSSASRPFAKSRICWYTDTRTGDFLIDYHPGYKGLFVATGGSGHAFKFLPVIGEKIVECVLGRTPEDFVGKWNWPEKRVSEKEWVGDGSRGGPVGMDLGMKMKKKNRGKL